jgi:DNA polymerase III subunit delta'
MATPLVSEPLSSAFAPLVGQPQAVALLLAAVQHRRIAPAYLFVGAPGVGRRLAAECFAEVLLRSQTSPERSPRHRIRDRNHPDLFWVEPTYLHQGQLLTAAAAQEQNLKRRSPPQIRLEQIRQIAQFLGRPPLEAMRSLVVVDDANTMAESAANGLLKTLEEPGAATIILIAPSVDSLLPTLVSRCQQIPFRRLSPEAIAQVLTQAGHEELLQYPDVLALAQGSPGEAIASWQQRQTLPPEILEAIASPPATLRQALDLARPLASLPAESQLWLIDYWQQTLWQTTGNSAYLHPLESARRALRSFAQPRLVWEVALMQLLEAH